MQYIVNFKVLCICVKSICMILTHKPHIVALYIITRAHKYRAHTHTQ